MVISKDKVILSCGRKRRCWSYHRGALFWKQESDSQGQCRGAMGPLVVGVTLLVTPFCQPWFSDLHNGDERTTPIGNNSDGPYEFSAEPKQPETKEHLLWECHVHSA